MKHVLPFGTIIFVVTGLIFAGSGDTHRSRRGWGVVATAVVVAAYREIDPRHHPEIGGIDPAHHGDDVHDSHGKSTAFSQILAFTGASRGLVELVVSFPFPEIMIVGVMQFLMIILGTFMEPVSIMMITFPVYMPIVKAFGFDPIWFGLLTLINMEIGMKTPPFGMVLFVMKGVVPSKTTMLDIYRSVTPFVIVDVVAMLPDHDLSRHCHGAAESYEILTREDLFR